MSAIESIEFSCIECPQAASVFILYLTTTANDICKSNKRSTITAADVLEALHEIQFDDLVPKLQEYLSGLFAFHSIVSFFPKFPVIYSHPYFALSWPTTASFAPKGGRCQVQEAHRVRRGSGR